ATLLHREGRPRQARLRWLSGAASTLYYPHREENLTHNPPFRQCAEETASAGISSRRWRGRPGLLPSGRSIEGCVMLMCWRADSGEFGQDQCADAEAHARGRRIERVLCARLLNEEVPPG